MLWVRFPGQTLVTGNVWGKSCTGGITLKNVLDLSVLHSYLNQINNKTLTLKQFQHLYILYLVKLPSWWLMWSQ